MKVIKVKMTTVIPMCIILVINFLTLRKTLSITPLKFLRKDFKKKLNNKVLRLPSFSFINRFRLRIILQNKGSFVMFFIGIFLASFLLIFALCINPLITHQIENLEEGCVSDYQYILKEPVGTVEDVEQAEAFTIYSMETKVINFNTC